LFWFSSWLEGQAPRNIAPALFDKSKRKNFSVFKALTNQVWIANLGHLTTTEELYQFVLLWGKLQNVVLDPEVQDAISWRWTVDGEYTAQSAYKIQFEGSRRKPVMMQIWKAKTEPKCKVFAWLLLHQKVLTANNLAKRGWPHDPICKLCRIENETPQHLCKDCPYTQEVWKVITSWLNLQDFSDMDEHLSINRWWQLVRRKVAQTHRTLFDGVVIFFWWNIWKERNRRTFENKQLSVTDVAFRLKEQIDQHRIALASSS
jgi:hypothetical protein